MNGRITNRQPARSITTIAHAIITSDFRPPTICISTLGIIWLPHLSNNVSGPPIQTSARAEPSITPKYNASCRMVLRKFSQSFQLFRRSLASRPRYVLKGARWSGSRKEWKRFAGHPAPNSSAYAFVELRVITPWCNSPPVRATADCSQFISSIGTQQCVGLLPWLLLGHPLLCFGEIRRWKIFDGQASNSFPDEKQREPFPFSISHDGHAFNKGLH